MTAEGGTNPELSRIWRCPRRNGSLKTEAQPLGRLPGQRPLSEKLEATPIGIQAVIRLTTCKSPWTWDSVGLSFILWCSCGSPKHHVSILNCWCERCAVWGCLLVRSVVHTCEVWVLLYEQTLVSTCSSHETHYYPSGRNLIEMKGKFACLHFWVPKGRAHSYRLKWAVVFSWLVKNNFFQIGMLLRMDILIYLKNFFNSCIYCSYKRKSFLRTLGVSQRRTVID